MRNDASPRKPASTDVPTPYQLKLRAAVLDAIGTQDATAAELLGHMIGNVQRGSYGMAARFYRMLPMRFRQRVGAPPRDRDEDEAAPVLL